MRLSSYSWLLIACCFCSIVTCFEEDEEEFPIEFGSFPESLRGEPPGKSSEEEEDIECSKKCSSSSELRKRSANPEDSPIFFRENLKEVEMKAPRKNPKKLRRSRKKNQNGKRRRKSKSSKKSAAKPLVTPSLFIDDFEMGTPANNPEMSAPSQENTIFALPEKEGGSINLSDPTKEQFRVEKKKGLEGFFSNGLELLHQTLDDNFGIQVPSKLFEGGKKVGFLEALAKKEPIQDDAKQLKQGASVPTGPARVEKPIRKTERENIELTMQIVDLLTDVNVNTEDPESLKTSLKEIKSNLTSSMPK